MNNYKKEILDKICYTELVYKKNNRKLNLELSKDKIKEMIFAIIKETDETGFQKTGKNIYITNNERNVRLTINSYTNRIITADQLNKKQRTVNVGLTVCRLTCFYEIFVLSDQKAKNNMKADIRLTQFVSAMPNKIKYGGPQSRPSFRAAMKSYLPPELLAHDSKRENNAPFRGIAKEKRGEMLDKLVNNLPNIALLKK